MNKLTKMMTTGGFGLLAALAVGSGPAQAVTVDSAMSPRPSSSHVQLREGVQVTGFYGSPRSCELAGRFGARGSHWDTYSCSPVRLGPRNGAWALQVASYDNWERRGFDVPLRAVCAFPTSFRPTWVGQYSPGRPARVIRGYSGPAIHGHPGRVVFSGRGQAMQHQSGPAFRGPRGAGERMSERRQDDMGFRNSGMGSRDNGIGSRDNGVGSRDNRTPGTPSADRPGRPGH